MQTTKQQLIRHQAILAHHGFYRGKMDGIWGPDCIAAKREFELSPAFKPAYPNNGLPFNLDQPLPDGVYIEPKGPLKLLAIKGQEMGTFDDNLIDNVVEAQAKLPKVEAPAKEVQAKPEAQAKPQAKDTGLDDLKITAAPTKKQGK